MREVTRQHPLIGLYFHTFKTTKGQRTVEYQGQIKDVVTDGVLVQLFDWFIGAPSAMRWFPRAAVKSWDLYESIEDMRHAYEYKHRHAACG